MKKILLMKKLLTVLLFTKVLLADDGWKNLPEVSNHPNDIYLHYESKDYNIKKEIEYFELRKFLFKDDKQLSKKYIPFHIIENKALFSYTKKIQSWFEALPFSDDNLTHIKTEIYQKNYFHTSQYFYKINGYFIKKDNSVWTINEKKDLLWVFDGIDTEAELLWFLWMYDDYIFKVKYEYKELKDGYEVRKTELSYPKYDKSRDESYSDATIDIFLIKRDGSYRKEFLKKEKQYLGRVISVPSRPSYLARETKESILSMDSFVSPTKFFLIF